MASSLRMTSAMKPDSKEEDNACPSPMPAAVPQPRPWSWGPPCGLLPRDRVFWAARAKKMSAASLITFSSFSISPTEIRVPRKWAARRLRVPWWRGFERRRLSADRRRDAGGSGAGPVPSADRRRFADSLASPLRHHGLALADSASRSLVLYEMETLNDLARTSRDVTDCAYKSPGGSFPVCLPSKDAPV